MVKYLLTTMLFFMTISSPAQIADPKHYLSEIKEAFTRDWPDNRTINLVFHGHSVPAGYFKTPEVNTLASYPFLILKLLKEQYPFAVINAINTSIGGENSVQGAKRFVADVLTHKPDVLFIDYILNDRWVSLEESKTAWESMVKRALEKKIKVILLTPSPDLTENILDPNAPLVKYTEQVRALAARYKVGLIDSYALFQQRAASGESLEGCMSQHNHPNEKGHLVIANEIMKYFK